MHRVLVVDDEMQMRNALYEVLKRRGYEVIAEGRGEDAIGRLAKERFSAVITDVKMPGMNGLELLRSVKKIDPALPVVMITAFGTIENAIEAMKEGASDYVLKPFSPDLIESVVNKALSLRQNEKDFGIVTGNEKMLDILDIARGIAPTLATVLIMGESGTGKELLARFIHASSDRKNKPFVAINCASIPDGLLESELFGYEKGAFTGAISSRKGKFEAAHGGTLLLDEVGEMGAHLQAKLLRVLQQKEVDRLGGQSPVSVDIRVIATTNRDLKKEVDAGKFREDLYYRLNVFPIILPPLRGRHDDIKLLAEHFVSIFNKKNSKKIKGINRDAVKCLQSHQWRGNVRELQNVIERAVLMCKGKELLPQDLFYGERFEESAEQAERVSEKGSLRDMERELIQKTLRSANGNKTKAANILGISVRTLRNKMKEYLSDGVSIRCS